MSIEPRVHSGDLGWLSWATAARDHPAESVTGDLAVVEGDERVALLCVIDGLGHGSKAAEVASLVAGALAAGQRERPRGGLQELFTDADAAARKTRGAALTLVRIERDGLVLEWAGVGNVDGVLYTGGRRERVYLTPGIVGFRTPRPRITRVQLEKTAVLAVATDGLRPELVEDRRIASEVADGALARALLQEHASGRDDELLLLGRVGETA